MPYSLIMFLTLLEVCVCCFQLLGRSTLFVLLQYKEERSLLINTLHSTIFVSTQSFLPKRVALSFYTGMKLM